MDAFTHDQLEHLFLFCSFRFDTPRGGATIFLVHFCLPSEQKLFFEHFCKYSTTGQLRYAFEVLTSQCRPVMLFLALSWVCSSSAFNCWFVFSAHAYNTCKTLAHRFCDWSPRHAICRAHPGRSGQSAGQPAGRSARLPGHRSEPARDGPSGAISRNRAQC